MLVNERALCGEAGGTTDTHDRLSLSACLVSENREARGWGPSRPERASTSLSQAMLGRGRGARQGKPFLFSGCWSRI